MAIKGKLFTDGGARGNPGPAGIGGVLEFTKESKRTPRFFKDYIGEATNNQAEYQAVLAGLGMAAEAGVTELDVYLDSELIVKQLSGWLFFAIFIYEEAFHRSSIKMVVFEYITPFNRSRGFKFIFLAARALTPSNRISNIGFDSNLEITRIVNI